MSKGMNDVLVKIANLRVAINEEFERFNDNDQADHQRVIKLHAGIDRIQRKRERRTDEFVRMLNAKFPNWRAMIRTEELP